MQTVHSLQLHFARIAVLAATALIPILLLWPHLSGQAVFVGDSDRLNHFLTILRFLTDGYREGRIYSWDPYVFGGFPVVSFTNPYPTSALYLLWPPERLFHAAGVVSCMFVVAAAWSAYTFLRDLEMSQLPSFVGAALYVLCAYAILKISQNDATYSAIVLIPLGMLSIRRIRRDNLVSCYVASFLVLTYLMVFSFPQKAAYAFLLFASYALFRTVIHRNPRIALVYLAAASSALLVSFPRIYAVAEDFLGSDRYTRLAHRSFNQIWNDSAFGLREAFRWFDDRLFGRHYAEVLALGNNFNLHEGMLLYMSAFAAFFLLYGLFRHRSRVFAVSRKRAEDHLFFLAATAVCFAVVTTKLGYYVAYLLFFKIDFIHSRIVIAAMLPLSALIALLLQEELEGKERYRFKATWSIVLCALGVGLIVAAVIEQVATYFGSSTISITFSRRSGTLHLVQGAAYRILLSLVVLAGLLWAGRRWRSRANVSTFALYVLAFVMVAQAFFYARSQLVGDHMRGQWPPFRSATRLLANHYEFSVPTSEEASQLGAALETEHFRTSFVCPPDISGIYCPTHLAHFWKIRAIDGYLQSVPRRLAVVPWGEGAITPRALMFTDSRSLPWGLLGLYNVKYAIMLSPELMTNTVLLAGGVRHFQPADLTVLRNPLPVAPRVFFVQTVTSVNDLEAALAALFPEQPGDKAYDPVANSVVEGFANGSSFPREGYVQARFEADAVDVTFQSSPFDRFLVINERYDPRWKASAGDRELRIYPTNVLMRGLVIPAGIDHVTMRYVPPTQSIAAWICYGAAATLFVVFVMGLRRLQNA